MANMHGYNQLFSTEPETWFVSGEVQVDADGYTVTTSPLPRGIVGLTHNGTGDYTLLLSECWFDLLHASIATKNDGGEIRLVQQTEDNVGASGTVDGEQGVSFLTVTDAGTPTNLPDDGIISFCLILKRSSA